MRRILVVLNPASGRGRGRRLKSAIEAELSKHASALEWRICETFGPGHASELARSAKPSKLDAVIAAGGDGTLSEVLAGVMSAPSGYPRQAIGLIPIGTGNDFSRTMGVERSVSGAVRILAEAAETAVDVGVCNGRPFINAVSCGFDAAVGLRINRGFRRLRGTAAYVAAVLSSLRTYRPVLARMVLDGQEIAQRIMLCAVANGRTYGGGMRVAPSADPADGLLDVVRVAAISKAEFLRTFPRVFRGTHVGHPAVQIGTARQIRIETDPPSPVLIDGELLGATPIEVGIQYRAVRFLRPPDP